MNLKSSEFEEEKLRAGVEVGEGAQVDSPIQNQILSGQKVNVQDKRSTIKNLSSYRHVTVQFEVAKSGKFPVEVANVDHVRAVKELSTG